MIYKIYLEKIIIYQNYKENKENHFFLFKVLMKI